MVTPTTSALGIFEGHDDIGTVKIPGAAEYNKDTQEYTVAGAGTNMWNNRDEFHFAWKRMKGDFILRARARFLGKGVDPHRKLGWIVRTSLTPESAYADAAIHGDGLTSLQFRRTEGAVTEEVRSPFTSPDIIQLARRGPELVMSVAHDGEPFGDERVLELPLGDEVYVGLFLTSHNPDVLEKAVFDNVRITIPAWSGLVPYRDYLGSVMEILDVASGRSRTIYSSGDSFEAPNWTPDGRALIYNSKGRLFRFDLASRTRTAIDTAFATRNNNDHCLSFDGKMIGISHHSPDHGGKSIVYTLPATGGTPTQVTPNGPSYLHGWSPDGKTLIYTADRGDGNYDIYSIGVEGGAEKRLTTAPGLDDGSEFTPDGTYIYFNSVRSGLMQIWRMRPDGTHQEQVTDDAFNNWFPHVSPDGKQLIFLSYGQDVDPGAHPYYKHVYLRMMPVAASGAKPKVVAYVYGGQGTINVNSWSPDSKQVAFVSNTLVR
jgi:Tol biopolymer transport system component